MVELVGDALCGKSFGPIGRNNAFAGQKVDVGGGIHRHHVGVQTVVDRASLGTRAAMRLVNLHIFACGLFVVGHKRSVVVFVKLAGHVVGGIQQSLGGYVEARYGQQGGSGNGFDFVHGAAQKSKDAIVGPPLQNSNESFVVCLYE
jgi:hypothetical protein